MSRSERPDQFQQPLGVLDVGFPSLQQAVSATVWRILPSNKVQPHRMRYSLERRDPEFERKMVEVLYVYKEVELLREAGPQADERLVVLSCDEKPSLRAIGTTAPDRPPVPGSHPSWVRDHEYIRHGTMSLLAAIEELNRDPVVFRWTYKLDELAVA